MLYRNTGVDLASSKEEVCTVFPKLDVDTDINEINM